MYVVPVKLESAGSSAGRSQSSDARLGHRAVCIDSHGEVLKTPESVLVRAAKENRLEVEARSEPLRGAERQLWRSAKGFLDPKAEYLTGLWRSPDSSFGTKRATRTKMW